MAGWMNPAHVRDARKRPQDTVDWRDRVIAAAIAPPLFWLALYLSLVPLKLLGPFSFSFAFLLPKIVFAVVGAGAACYGAIKGLSGLADLMGHAFWTHQSNERDIRWTVAIWTTVVALAGALALIS